MNTDSTISTPLVIEDKQQFLVTCCITDSKDSFLYQWRKWKKAQDFDLLDFESLILIPTLYKQVEKFDIVDENKARYKGIYKKSWVNTVQIYQDILPSLNELKELNIPFWIVGSVSLENLYYKDCGIHRSNGVEVLANKKSISEVLNFLLSKGFFIKDKKSTHDFVTTKLSFGKVIQLINHNGSIIYLSLGEFPFLLTTNYFEDNQLPFTVNNYQFNTLRPEFEVLRLIANSFFNKSNWHVQWIVDVKYILNEVNNEFDWNYFQSLAMKYEIANIVGSRLQLLINVGIKSIPIQCVNQLISIDSPYNVALLNTRNRHSKIQTFKFNAFILKKMKEHQEVNWSDYLRVLFNEKSFVKIIAKMIKRLFK